MDLAQHAESKFAYIVFAGMALGFAIPAQASMLEPYISLLLGISMFFVFLKVDFPGLVGYAKRPWLLAYIIAMFLLALPAAAFLLAGLAGSAFAVAMLLIFGGPGGITGAVLVDLMKGELHLHLLLQFFLYLLAPLTLPFLMFYMAGNAMNVSSLDLFLTLIKLLVVPLAAAQAVKVTISAKKAQGYTSPVAALMMSLIGMAVMGKHAAYIASNLVQLAVNMVSLAPFYVLMSAAGYYMCFWLGAKERKSLAITKAFPNGTLILVLASQFFGPEITSIALASFIFWYVYFAAVKHFFG